jgi:thymidylate kinase
MKLIEFVGMPRSGKSSQAELLRKALEARGKTAIVVGDRERMAQLSVPPQESLAFALAFYGQLLDSYYRYKDQAEYMIVDRGWSDAPVWADVYRELKTVNDAEAAALAECYGRFARLATAVVCMDVTPETSLARHRATLHEDVDDVAMNPEWLAALAAAYARRNPEFTNPVDVDGTLPPEEAHVRIMGFLEATGSV